MMLYHYSHLKDQIGIQEGSWKSSGKPGLGATLRLGTTYPPARDFSAVFCHLSPLPKSWISNSEFPGIWQHFRSDMGTVLLEIYVDENKDSEIFVVDRGHVEGFLFINKERVPQRYLHQTREEAEKAYFDSRIPLRDYLAKSGEIGFSLPEVVIEHDVPLEQIRISSEQPLLEKNIREGRSVKELQHVAQDIPALQEWYKTYQNRMELQSEGKVPLV